MGREARSEKREGCFCRAICISLRSLRTPRLLYRAPQLLAAGFYYVACGDAGRSSWAAQRGLRASSVLGKVRGPQTTVRGPQTTVCGRQTTVDGPQTVSFDTSRMELFIPAMYYFFCGTTPRMRQDRQGDNIIRLRRLKSSKRFRVLENTSPEPPNKRNDVVILSSPANKYHRADEKISRDVSKGDQRGVLTQKLP